MDNYKASVCVCVAVRNAESTIEFTLSSLINQNYPNYEILICDNLSTDNTKQIILDYKSKSKLKITYLLNEKPGSAEENWNFLLKNLPESAQYCSIYHADDIYDPLIITKSIDILEKNRVGAVFTMSKLIDDNGIDVTKKYSHRVCLPQLIKDKNIFNYFEIMNSTLRFHNIIRTPSFFFNKDILKDHNSFFDSKFRTSADLDFWLRIAKTNNIAIINEPLLSYRTSKKQGTYVLLQNREVLGDFFEVIDSHLLGNEFNKSDINYYQGHKCIELIYCSINLLKNNKEKEGIELLSKTVSINNLFNLIKVDNGLRFLLVAFLLKISYCFNFHKFFIKIIDRNRKY